MAKATVNVELDHNEITTALTELAKKHAGLGGAGSAKVEFKIGEDKKLTGATVEFQHNPRAGK
jgi:hypothetical protein